MKFLVTGCAGFIGWRVSRLLLSEGHSVVGLDNLNKAYDVRLKNWRLDDLMNIPNFQSHRIDICDLGSILRVMRDNVFDGVVNLAARAGVRQSLEEPQIYYDTNVTGTLNLLEACRQQEVAKFVLASTSSVYGDVNPPFLENASADRQISPYAASKKAAENLCHVYHNAYGMDAIALRFFTVFGPAGRPDMAIYRFIRWIFEGEKIVLYGDGSQSRDFTYVEDIARGVSAALKLSGFEVINLGADRPVEIRLLISMLEELIGKSAIIDQREANISDVNTTWANIDKAREMLDWEPLIDLVEGLSCSVEWYKTHRRWAREINVWC